MSKVIKFDKFFIGKKEEEEEDLSNIEGGIDTKDSYDKNFKKEYDDKDEDSEEESKDDVKWSDEIIEKFKI